MSVLHYIFWGNLKCLLLTRLKNLPRPLIKPPFHWSSFAPCCWPRKKKKSKKERRKLVLFASLPITPQIELWGHHCLVFLESGCAIFLPQMCTLLVSPKHGQTRIIPAVVLVSPGQAVSWVLFFQLPHSSPLPFLPQSISQSSVKSMIASRLASNAWPLALSSQPLGLLCF